MKNKYISKSKIIVYSIVLLMSISSCNKVKERKLKNKINDKSVELIQIIIQTYDKVSIQSYVNQNQKEEIGILLSSLSDTLISPDFSKANFANNEKRKEIFKALKKLYIKYDLLYDKNYNVKGAKIKENVELACKALDGVELSKEDEKTKSDILLTVKSTKYDANLVLYNLTEIYVGILERDIKNWKLFIEEMYKTYEKGIKEIPSSVFDKEKVNQLVNKPYKDEDIIINFYKLKLRDDANKKKKRFIEMLSKTYLAFETLNRLNAEDTKKNKSVFKTKKLYENMVENVDTLKNW